VNSRSVFVFAAALLLPCASRATDVSGTISTQTWTKANSPYYVATSATVPAGDTLTIEAGTRVILMNGASMTVRGWLSAEGTELENVQFLADSFAYAFDRWSEISFREGSVGRFRWTLIAGGPSDPSGNTFLVRNGGVTIYDADVTFDHCVLTSLRNTHPAGWSESRFAGAVYVRGSSTLTMRDCQISSCVADGGLYWNGEGGALCAESGARVVLSRCKLAANRALNGAGGAIKLVRSAVTMDSCEVSGNTVQGLAMGPYSPPGGGISAEDSTQLVMRSCVVKSNQTRSEGGGIAVSGGSTATLKDCRIYDNTAYVAGAGIYAGSGAFLHLTDCTVQNNRIGDWYHNYEGRKTGAGIAVIGATASLHNALVARNQAPPYYTMGGQLWCAGGGVFVSSGTLNLSSCTIAGNLALDGGGAVYSDNSTVTIANSILCADSTSALVVAPDSAAAAAVVTYSNVQGSSVWPGVGNINADPCFADTATGDYSLLVNSPCIDAGDPLARLDPDGTRADMGVWMPDLRRPVPVAIAPKRPAFSLLQNRPNPFNPSTTIRFVLPEASHVTLAVYDINGRLVRNLVGGAAGAAGTFLPGHHEVVWDGRDSNDRPVASGVYLCRLTAPQGSVTRRMTLAR